ncbi:ABC transporter ATP-binding protein [Thalassospira alkalitolerans]|uniref:ABC transporter ATP-binding protein n=1 Tax=Thalassospira alkalitolerans TaxID=1293890 RepID=UPI003AA906BB
MINISNFKLYAGLFIKDFGFVRSFLLFVVMVFSAVMDGFRILTITMLFPFIGLSGGDGGVISKIFNFFGFYYVDIGFHTVTLIIVLSFLFQSIVFLAQSWMMETFTESSVRELRLRLMSSLIQAKWTFFISRSSSEFSTALTSEVLRVRTCISSMLGLIYVSIVAFCYFVYAVYVSPLYSCVLILCGLIVFVVNKFVSKSIKKVSIRISYLYRDMNHRVSEFITNAKFVKANNGFDSVIPPYESRSIELYQVVRFGGWLPSLSTVLSEFIAILSIVGVVYYIVKSGDTGGEILIVLLLFLRIFPRVTTAMQFFQQMLLNYPALTFICELLFSAEKEVEKTESVGVLVASNFLQESSDVKIQGVTVHRGGMTVLDGVSFDVNAGEICAIVGPSGAGKSTLIDVLLRLIEVDEGGVTLGGFPQEAIDVVLWRDLFCYLPQSGAVVSGSVKDNVNWFKRGAAVDETYSALEFACAREFVVAMEGAIDAQLASDGSNLSGGQRQRIGLARAFLHRGPFLVFDEPTSALDGDIERRIIDNVLALKGGKTIFLVTHRLQLLREVDLIVYMDNGKVIEKGNWEYLMKKKGVFYKSICRV